MRHLEKEQPQREKRGDDPAPALWAIKLPAEEGGEE
jgi:hypothetical protein